MFRGQRDRAPAWKTQFLLLWSLCARSEVRLVVHVPHWGLGRGASRPCVPVRCFAWEGKALNESRGPRFLRVQVVIPRSPFTEWKPLPHGLAAIRAGPASAGTARSSKCRGAWRGIWFKSASSWGCGRMAAPTSALRSPSAARLPDLFFFVCSPQDRLMPRAEEASGP